MPSKLQMYEQMADQTAKQVTGSFGEWTAFLETMGRLYKYPFHEQLMFLPTPSRTKIGTGGSPMITKRGQKMCQFRMIMTHGAAGVLMSMSAPKLTPVLSIYSSTALERNRSLQQRKSRLCSKS